MGADAVMKDAEQRMQGAVAACHRDLQGIRTMRANPSLLENIAVEVYGTRMPINQVATVTAPEPRMLLVQVWDAKNAPAVNKAIGNSSLGLSPIAEATVIRVPLPEMTEQRRRELAKVAMQYAEKGRVAVRNVRRDVLDSLKKLEKSGDISEDELRDYSDQVQKKTDAGVSDIDALAKKKEADILQ
ncbi:MAG: ribosome recycling factor [Rickettsiales bacterium]